MLVKTKTSVNKLKNNTQASLCNYLLATHFTHHTVVWESCGKLYSMFLPLSKGGRNSPLFQTWYHRHCIEMVFNITPRTVKPYGTYLPFLLTNFISDRGARVSSKEKQTLPLGKNNSLCQVYEYANNMSLGTATFLPFSVTTFTTGVATGSP